MKKHFGFTLIELMITLVIVGVLLMVGVPSLKTFVQKSRLVAASNELISALHVARSEAIKLNTKVTICASSDGSACDIGSNDWANGWVVFVDADAQLDGTGVACTAAGTDCLLRTHAGFSANQLTVSGDYANGNPITSFTFSSRGLPKAVNGASRSGIFSICSLDDNGGTIDSRAVTLSLSGRVRASTNTEVISCP